MGIGGSTALEIPGGGTEGYHVLKVNLSIMIFCIFLDDLNISRFTT